STPVVVEPLTLRAPEWAAQESAHRHRARDLTRTRRERQQRGERHAVEDFLFDYYALRAGRLDRWHPGAGVRLAAEGAAPDDVARLEERATWRWHRAVDDGAVELDTAAFVADRGPA